MGNKGLMYKKGLILKPISKTFLKQYLRIIKELWI